MSYVYPQTVAVTVSVLTLTFISIDRWYAICFPLRYVSTNVRAVCSIAFIWALALSSGNCCHTHAIMRRHPSILGMPIRETQTNGFFVVPNTRRHGVRVCDDRTAAAALQHRNVYAVYRDVGLAHRHPLQCGPSHGPVFVRTHTHT